MRKDKNESGFNSSSKIEVICSFFMFLCRCTFLPFSFFVGFFSFLFLLKLIVGEEGAVSLLTSFAWPLAIVLVVLLFKSSIEHIVPRIKNLNILGLVLDLHSDATFRASQKLGNNDSAKNIGGEPEGIETESEEPEDAEPKIKEPEGAEPKSEEPKSAEPKSEERQIDELGVYEKSNRYLNNELLKDKNRETQDNIVKLSNKEKKESAKSKEFYNKYLSSKGDVHKIEKKGNKYFFGRDFEEDDFDSLWREVIALMNFLYIRFYGEDKGLNALEKAKYLYKSNVINVAQYMTFSKLYEVMEFWDQEVTGNARERYLVSITDLHKSLFKLYHSM